MVQNNFQSNLLHNAGKRFNISMMSELLVQFIGQRLIIVDAGSPEIGFIDGANYKFISNNTEGDHHDCKEMNSQVSIMQCRQWSGAG